MSLLLDTHSFLWCLFDPKKLSQRLARKFFNPIWMWSSAR